MWCLNFFGCLFGGVYLLLLKSYSEYTTKKNYTFFNPRNDLDFFKQDIASFEPKSAWFCVLRLKA